MTTTPKTTKTSKLKSLNAEVTASFIQKSYQLLEDNRFPDIVDWNTEGTGIIIKKPLEFGQVVLPNYFKHSNLTSFVRQLNMYDFRKRRSQDYEHSYYHDLFQRGKKNLLKEIRRKHKDPSVQPNQKAIETLKSAGTESSIDLAANLKENNELKNLNQEAANRIEFLEAKIMELTAQNKELMNQLYQQNQRDGMLTSYVTEFISRKKSESMIQPLGTQQPSIFGNQYNVQMGRQILRPDFAREELPVFLQGRPQINVKDFRPANVEALLNVNGNNQNSSSTDATCSTVGSKVLPKFQDVPQKDFYKQFSKRPLNFEEEGLESMGKMVKMEGLMADRMDSINLLNISRGISTEGDVWSMRPEEGLYRKEAGGLGRSEFINDSLDLITFN